MVRDYYVRNLRTAVGASGGPYGYTLTTWTTGAVLVGVRGLPSTFDALAFMAGAVLGFAVVGTAAFGGVAARFEEPPRRSALWGNFHVLSVGLAILAASLVAHQVRGGFAWPATSFFSTVVYLLVLGAELAAADERGPSQE